MKKRICLVLAAVCLAGVFVGCEKKDDGSAKAPDVSRDDFIATLETAGYKEHAPVLGKYWRDDLILEYDGKCDEYMSRISTSNLDKLPPLNEKLISLLKEMLAYYEPMLSDSRIPEDKKTAAKQAFDNAKKQIAKLEKVKDNPKESLRVGFEDTKKMLVEKTYPSIKEGVLRITGETITPDGTGYITVGGNKDGVSLSLNMHYIKEGDTWKMDTAKTLEETIKFLQDMWDKAQGKSKLARKMDDASKSINDILKNMDEPQTK
jgi:hypothetical protein